MLFFTILLQVKQYSDINVFNDTPPNRVEKFKELTLKFLFWNILTESEGTPSIFQQGIHERNTSNRKVKAL